MRERKLRLAIAVTSLLLVPLSVLGGPALAGSQGSSSAQYQYKVTICHQTGSVKNPWEEISVSNQSLDAHMDHGDFIVTNSTPCPPQGG
jgi:hypothetical protein